MGPTSRMMIVFAAGLTVGAVAATVLTYSESWEKWTKLGRMAGRLDAEAELMAQMCASLPRTAGAPTTAAYVLDVKASRLSLATGPNGGLTLHCQDVPPRWNRRLAKAQT